jgi:hypothetical protein
VDYFLVWFIICYCACIFRISASYILHPFPWELIVTGFGKTSSLVVLCLFLVGVPGFHQPLSVCLRSNFGLQIFYNLLHFLSFCFFCRDFSLPGNLFFPNDYIINVTFLYLSLYSLLDIDQCYSIYTMLYKCHSQITSVIYLIQFSAHHSCDHTFPLCESCTLVRVWVAWPLESSLTTPHLHLPNESK